MKRTYIKPQIAFESLSLSSNIAAGCEMLSTNSAERVCPVKIKDQNNRTIFVEHSCDMYSPDGIYDSICYGVPVENSNVFTS